MPNEFEMGAIALQGMCVLVLTGLGFQWVFSRAWRGLGTSNPNLRKLPTLILALLSIAISIPTLSIWTPSWNSAVEAFVFVGPVYLFYLCIASRLLLLRSSFSWAPVLGWTVLTSTSLWLAFKGEAVFGEFSLIGPLPYFWEPALMLLLPIPPFLLGLELVLRHWDRRRQERERQRAQEPSIPRAHVVEDEEL